MKASLNLLKKFVDLEGITPNEIADKLTFAGLEVEDLYKVCDVNNLVIGEIIECVDHPESDHLHILNVDLGPVHGVKQIVCGAPNARVGIKVIVANIGAQFKKANMTIVKSTIRGVESNGMCCSLLELGVDKAFLSEKQISGIEELPSDAVVGNENVLEYLGLDDYIIDINILANRSDCLAIFSLAKELGALFSRKVNIPTPIKYEELKSDVKVSSECEDCKQFSIKVVDGVVTKPSPSWLVSFLRSHGIRSINNIVDIGNYVMILTGQPLHMYDLNKLPSKEFIVKNNITADFVALDEKTYSVTEGDICITNGDKIGCLGGVMGALVCTCDDNTSTIAVEAANFKGATVRRTTVKTGLSSDSSARFIKGINPYQDRFVLDLTAQLLVELADAKDIYETVRYSEIDEKLPEIECTYSYINKRLGTSFTKEEMNDVFAAYDIKINPVDDDKFIAIPPAHRIDIRVNADLTEEVIRYIGIDKIKPTLPEMVTTVGGLNPAQSKKKAIREHLISNGLHEVLTYTLISPTLDSKFVSLNNDEAIKVMNPMTVDHSLVRRGITASLIEVLEYNLSHKNKDINIFEVSDVQTAKRNFQELCIVLNGSKNIRGIYQKRPYDFYDIYGYFLSIMKLLGIDEKRYKVERLLDSPYYHPGRAIKVSIGKEVVAVLGELHPLVSKDLGRTYVLDMNLSSFINMKVSQTKMAQISRFPSVERDYAFIVSKDVLVNDMIMRIKKEGRGIISSINVFDVYEGELIDANVKSVALKITYSSLEKTLKDEDIIVVEQAMYNTLSRNFNAYLRV